jgi:hypothetical protein
MLPNWIGAIANKATTKAVMREWREGKIKEEWAKCQSPTWSRLVGWWRVCVCVSVTIGSLSASYVFDQIWPSVPTVRTDVPQPVWNGKKFLSHSLAFSLSPGRSAAFARKKHFQAGGTSSGWEVVVSSKNRENPEQGVCALSTGAHPWHCAFWFFWRKGQYWGLNLGLCTC